MSDLKLAPSKYGTCEIWLKLERPKGVNLDICVPNFGKQMWDLKSSSSKQDTSKILLRLEN